jgi:hypothetical protein
MTTITWYSLLKQWLSDLPGVISGRLCPKQFHAGPSHALCNDFLRVFRRKIGTMTMKVPGIYLIDQEGVDVYSYAYCKL